ncbi:MAG: hypothetical protein KBC35_00065 [Candidatus Pacebacteria bacterium]|nr:hypothetical protein [Candidatus Paceibacterota bacterium]
MKSILGFVFVFLCIVTPTFAYEVYTTEPSEPYALIPFTEDIEDKQVYGGVLRDFPVMYETTIVATSSLRLQLVQKYRGGADPLAFGIMIVRVDEAGGGVSEIARLRPAPEQWRVRRDRVFGMTFLESEVVTHTLEPGTYRVEVSTPENLGSYLLMVGEYDERLGYFATLDRVRSVQKVFGYSIFNMLRSSYVYYPLGIILLLAALQRTWRYRRSIGHA